MVLRSNRWQVVYQWSDSVADRVDLTRYLESGFSLSLKRNKIGTLSLKLKYRNILAILQALDINLGQYLQEWRSSVQVYEDDSLVFGGVLDSWPEINTSSLDADIQLDFQSWLGLCQGIAVEPPQQLSGTLDKILVEQFRKGLRKAQAAGSPLPLSVGSHVETLASVTWTVDNFMTLQDFLTQRCDNTTGAGEFDINFTPDGQLEVWKRYGYDTTSNLVLQLGGPGTNVEGMDFPRWNGYYTDAVVSGAGNGYGADGTTLVAHAYNRESRKRHYFYELIGQDSSISTPEVLQAAAQKRLKYSAQATATPTVTINATRLRLKTCEHAQGGDLWLGDTVLIKPTGIYEGLPMPAGNKYRVDQMDITVDAQHMTTVKMGMCDPTGGAVSAG